MKFPLTVMYDINNCGKIGLVHIVYQTERPTEQVTYIHDIEIDAIAFHDKCYINWSRHIVFRLYMCYTTHEPIVINMPLIDNYPCKRKSYTQECTVQNVH